MSSHIPLWPLSIEEQESRDRLVLSAYEASVDPLGYGTFLENLAMHLGLVAGKISELENFESVDFSAVDSDRGLIEHLQKVGSIIERLESAPKFGTLPQRVASNLGQQVLFDERGTLLATSTNAACFFEGEVHSFQSFLNLLFTDDAANLRQMLKAMSKGENPPPIAVRGESLHLIARCVYPEVRLSPFLLVESLNVPWSHSLSETLRKSYGLTKAEQRVVQQLSAGHTVSEIALHSGRKEGTVRNQVKSLLAKTGVNGQANLIRLVVMLAGAIPDMRKPDGNPAPTQGETEFLALDNGRAMEVRLLGPRTGRGLVFIHGQLYGTEMPTEVLHFLDQHNLRLICPSRPGFGSSDPFPGSVEVEPKRLADDIARVMDHFGLKSTVLVANITGALYAYSVAGQLPDRVSGIVCAGGALPMKEAHQYVDAAARQRTVVYLGRFVPALLPPLLQAGISQIKEGREIDFLEGLYRKNTPDRLLLSDPDKKDLLRRSVHFGVSQGYHGVYNDTYHLVRDWSPWVTTTCQQGTQSVYVHGEDDPVTKITSVRRFASHHSLVRVDEVPNCGQLVLFDKPMRVFEAARDLLEEGRAS